MFKRLLKLAIFAAIASAIASAVKMATQGPPQHDTSAASTAGSVDTWPEVPRNPDAP